MQKAFLQIKEPQTLEPVRTGYNRSPVEHKLEKAELRAEERVVLKRGIQGNHILLLTTYRYATVDELYFYSFF